MKRIIDQGTGSIFLLEARPRKQDRCALAFLSEPRMSWLEIPIRRETLRITDEVADWVSAGIPPIGKHRSPIL